MTPDKEQVVEPLGATEEAQLRRGQKYGAPEVALVYIDRLLATLDVARTASVAGLDDGRTAVEDGLWDKWTPGEKLAYGVGYRRGRSAPSIEQEPGGQFTIGGDPHGWSAPSGTTSDPAALREQEPGEMLRATASERPDDRCVCGHWRTGPLPNSGHLDTPPHICTVSLGDEWCPCTGFRQKTAVIVNTERGLDAAWRDAEDAIGPFRDLTLRQQYDGRYLAGSSVRRGMGGIGGATPSDALRNLIAALEADRNPQETER